MNQTLYDLLIERLQTVAELPALQLENTNIDPQGKAFSRATLIRTRPSQGSVGASGRDRHSGLLQVDLFVPLGTGTTAANAIADEVISTFPRGLTLTSGALNLHVVRAYRETGGRLLDKFHQVPVSIEWWSMQPAS